MSTGASFGQGLIASTVLHTAAVVTLYTLSANNLLYSVPGNGVSGPGTSFISAEIVGQGGAAGIGLPASGGEYLIERPKLQTVPLSRQELSSAPEVSLSSRPPHPAPPRRQAEPATIPLETADAGREGEGGASPAPGASGEGTGLGGGGGSLSGMAGGTGARRAVLIEGPRPPYPRSARAAGFEGRVAMQIRIAETGRVAEAKLLKSSGRSDTDQAALETITSRWRFEPAMLDGHPVEWQEKVIVSFQLR